MPDDLVMQSDARSDLPSYPLPRWLASDRVYLPLVIGLLILPQFFSVTGRFTFDPCLPHVYGGDESQSTV